MMTVTLIDAVPLTALLNPNDERHSWARETVDQLAGPLLTSEPALTESLHLLRRDGCDADELFALTQAGLVSIGLRFDDEQTALRELMRRYRSVPMSLADATLVRLSELHRDCRVFTLDTDFRIYRRHGN
jgi:uncharacterized protein